jgi:hypothetical protein
MNIEYEVFFKNTPPSIDLVVEKLKDITGLEIKYDSEKYMLTNKGYSEKFV